MFYKTENIFNDSLEKKMEEICSRFGRTSYMKRPIAGVEVDTWERNNKIQIPSTYKKWLKISAHICVDNNLAGFYNPYNFKLIKLDNIPFVKIGEIIGDGEIICFTIKEQKFVRILDGHVISVTDHFEELLKKVVEIANDSLHFLENTAELILDMIRVGALPDELQNFLEFVKKEKTCDAIEEFNKLQSNVRRWFLSKLSKEQLELFVDILRRESVAQFWNNERKLIQGGECTREWTIEQVEAILNITVETGMCKSYAGMPPEREKQDGDIEKYYIARHICDVIKRPEYAGEPKNIQALTHEEYIDSVKAVYGYEISMS